MHSNAETSALTECFTPTSNSTRSRFVEVAQMGEEQEVATTPSQPLTIQAWRDNAREQQHQASTPTICFDFTKGHCKRGANCKYSHSIEHIISVNSQEKGVCFDWLKGACHRGVLCRFSHDLTNIQQQGSAFRQQQRQLSLLPPSPLIMEPSCSSPLTTNSIDNNHAIPTFTTTPIPTPTNQSTPPPPQHHHTTTTSNRKFHPNICYDFVRGACVRGSECRYSHDFSSILYGPSPRAQPSTIGGEGSSSTTTTTTTTPASASGGGHSHRHKEIMCMDWSKGRCSRSMCRFAHYYIPPPPHHHHHHNQDQQQQHQHPQVMVGTPTREGMVMPLMGTPGSGVNHYHDYHHRRHDASPYGGGVNVCSPLPQYAMMVQQQQQQGGGELIPASWGNSNNNISPPAMPSSVGGTGVQQQSQEELALIEHLQRLTVAAVSNNNNDNSMNQLHLSPSPLSTNPAAALVSANLQSPLSGVGHSAFDAAICSPPSVNNNNNINNNGSAKTFADVLHQYQHQPSNVTSPYYYSTKFDAHQQQQKDQGVAMSPFMFEAKQPHSIRLLTRGDEEEDASGSGISNDLLSSSLPSGESMMMAMLGDAVMKTKIRVNSSGATDGDAHQQQQHQDQQQQQPKSPLAEQFEAVNLIWSRNHQDGY